MVGAVVGKDRSDGCGRVRRLGGGVAHVAEQQKRMQQILQAGGLLVKDGAALVDAVVCPGAQGLARAEEEEEVAREGIADLEARQQQRFNQRERRGQGGLWRASKEQFRAGK